MGLSNPCESRHTRTFTQCGPHRLLFFPNLTPNLTAYENVMTCQFSSCCRHECLRFTLSVFLPVQLSITSCHCSTVMPRETRTTSEVSHWNVQFRSHLQSSFSAEYSCHLVYSFCHLCNTLVFLLFTFYVSLYFPYE